MCSGHFLYHDDALSGVCRKRVLITATKLDGSRCYPLLLQEKGLSILCTLADKQFCKRLFLCGIELVDPHTLRLYNQEERAFFRICHRNLSHVSPMVANQRLLATRVTGR